jgi:hypothetical protein
LLTDLIFSAEHWLQVWWASMLKHKLTAKLAAIAMEVIQAQYSSMLTLQDLLTALVKTTRVTIWIMVMPPVKLVTSARLASPLLLQQTKLALKTVQLSLIRNTTFLTTTI